MDTDHGMGFEACLDEPPARVDAAVETGTGPFPGALSPPRRDRSFVDGVRRIDQQLLATEGGAYGLFGTFAAGAVRSDGRAAFREHVVDRMLVTGGAWTPASRSPSSWAARRSASAR